MQTLLTRAQLCELVDMCRPNTYAYWPVTKSGRTDTRAVRRVLNDRRRNGQPEIAEGEWLPRLLSLGKAARELGASPATVRGWCESGAPCYRFAREYRVELEQLSAWASSPRQ